MGALEACQLGMYEVSHFTAMLEASVYRDVEPAEGIGPALEELVGSLGQEIFACLAERGGTVTPNLVIYAGLAGAGDEVTRNMTTRLLDRLGEAVLLLRDAGLPIFAVSDSPGGDPPAPWGISLHDEMALLQKAGLSSMEVLLSATSVPARFMGRLDEVGTIEAGKQADLVLLEENPLMDTWNTRRISWVVSRGMLVEPLLSASALENR